MPSRGVKVAFLQCGLRRGGGSARAATVFRVGAANSGSDTVSVVDPETYQLVTTFAAGAGAHGLAVIPPAT
jgi:YVTN family beta-propeller protein